MSNKPKNHIDCTLCDRVPVVRGTQQEYHEKYHCRTKHTPGPWIESKHFDKNEDVILQIVQIDDQSKVIATCDSPYDDANARLIAAAPEMLEALKAAMDGNIKRTVRYQMIAKAINKAEGKE